MNRGVPRRNGIGATVRARTVIVLLAGGVTFAASAALAPVARADAVADFYKGKNLQLIVAAGAGGGYDAYARMIARHMPGHMAGHPSIIVKNMQGAGGVIGANFIYNVAPRDGSLIGELINTAPFQPLLGRPEAKFDAMKFTWLGSASAETGLIFVNSTSSVKAFEDLRKTPITVGASGAGSSTTLYYRMVNKILGTKLKIILGYKGSRGGFLALERGEIDGYFSFWSSLKTRHSDLLKNKKIRLIVQIALEKDPQLPDVPLVLDFAKSQSDRQAMELAVAPLSMGRPFLGPPDIPDDRAKALQAAFVATMKDPGLIAEAKKRRLGVDAFTSGAQVLALLKRIYATPKKVVARVAALSKRKKKKRRK